MAGVKGRSGGWNRLPQCACGRPKTKGATRCIACTRPGFPVRICEGCGVEFSRKARRRDAFRYCSRACAFAHWSEIQRAAHPAKPKPVRQCRRCDAPIARLAFCATCRDIRAREAQLRARAVSLARSRRQRGITADINHTCPGCGRTFQSTPGRVACSRGCRRQVQRLVRQMRLSTLPPGEREQLASMIALVHSAYRRIDEIQNPTNSRPRKP